MGFKESTDALNNIHIQQVAEWLGVRLPRTGSMHCPVPKHNLLSKYIASCDKVKFQFCSRMVKFLYGKDGANPTIQRSLRAKANLIFF